MMFCKLLTNANTSKQKGHRGIVEIALGGNEIIYSDKVKWSNDSTITIKGKLYANKLRDSAILN